MRHAGTTDKACNSVIPNCSFVASPQFFLGIILQTIRIYLLLHIRGWWHSYATKIPMWPCPGYYSSYPELKMKEDQTKALVYGKNTTNVLWVKDIFSWQTNALMLWCQFYNNLCDLCKIIIAVYLYLHYLGAALMVTSVRQHGRNCWLIAQEFAQKPRHALQLLLSPFS